MGEPNLRTQRRRDILRQALELDDRGRLVEFGGPDDPAIGGTRPVPPMSRSRRDTPMTTTPPTAETDRRAVNHLIQKAVGLER